MFGVTKFVCLLDKIADGERKRKLLHQNLTAEFPDQHGQKLLFDVISK